MIDSVRAEQCDLVLHWASWPETFSLSTFEALCGGAYVLTNAVSGNVAATVRKTGRGAVLDDEADLFEFFKDGRAEAMITTLRKERREYQVESSLSRMSWECLVPTTQNAIVK